jgi:hypothetical protein
VTASLVPNAKQQFVDINGNPLVGGTVEFYLPMTLTPKNTWQDSAQTILNTNPVVLDSRGQAIIYGTGAYRQILRDADGNLIWDQEINGFQESVFGPQQVIAAATVTDLGSASSNNILISGTTTINNFGTSAALANPIYFIQFNNALTLTYNATSMVLPGGGNIIVVAGDSALVEVTNAAAGYWRMIAYFPSSVSGAFGTAANFNIGTSGGTVPLLNGINVWGRSNRFVQRSYGDETVIPVVAGASTPDFSNSNNFTVSTSVSITINNPQNVQTGQSGVIIITQTNAGLGLTLGTAYKAPGGAASLSLSGVAGASDYFAYYTHSPSFIVITPILNPT